MTINDPEIMESLRQLDAFQKHEENAPADLRTKMAVLQANAAVANAAQSADRLRSSLDSIMARNAPAPDPPPFEEHLLRKVANELEPAFRRLVPILGERASQRVAEKALVLVVDLYGLHRGLCLRLRPFPFCFCGARKRARRFYRSLGRGPQPSVGVYR